MKNEIKICRRRYNGDFGFGSIFQYINSFDLEGNIAKISTTIEFCCDFDYKKDTIVVNNVINLSDKAKKRVNEIIDEIKEYKHKDNDNDTKNLPIFLWLGYVDMLIDEEKYEIHSDSELLIELKEILKFEQNDVKADEKYNEYLENIKKSNDKTIDEIINGEDADAINELGCIYLNGEGVEANGEKAFKLFKAASEKGSVKGKINLAISYYKGKITEKNIPLAFDMFKEIAEKHNHYRGYYFLGEIYYWGKLGQEDYEKAFFYYNEALKINPDYEIVKFVIAHAYYYGQGVEKNEEKAFNMFSELVKKHEFKEAYYYLALCYYFGKGTQKDYEKAFLYFNKSLEYEKDIYTLYSVKYYLGVIYMYGKGIKADVVKSKRYFEEILEENHDHVYYKLALLYTGEFGLDKDEDKAKEYFNKIEIDLCIALIYYAITFDLQNLDEIYKILDSGIDVIKYSFLRLKKEHPAILYHNRLAHLTVKEYKDIVEKLKNKINICRREESFKNVLMSINNHEEVIEFGKTIIKYAEIAK